jgi:hypothetical protein
MLKFEQNRTTFSSTDSWTTRGLPRCKGPCTNNDEGVRSSSLATMTLSFRLLRHLGISHNDLHVTGKKFGDFVNLFVETVKMQICNMSRE